MGHTILVLGGTRSGKSHYAEGLVKGQHPIYIATAEACDDEMQERIKQHRRRRGPQWHTLEAPLELAAVLSTLPLSNQNDVLIDCVTVWLSNLLHYDRDPAAAQSALLKVLAQHHRTVVLVAHEVGLGVVPETSLGRQFCDHAGLLNQAIAAQADRVILVAAGLPMVLKNTPLY